MIPILMVLVLALAPLAAAQETQVPDSLRRVAAEQPLFATHEPLTVLVEAPLTTIFEERGAEPKQFPGKLTYTDAGGARHTQEVGFRTRGLARLRKDVCEFPPIRLDFDREDAEGTLFSGQNRMKLVTHCQNRTAEEQNVLEEYLAYRMLNQLTDMSFKVRLARITYVDTDGKADTLTRHAFLIENQDLLAARNGWRVVSVSVVPPDAVDPTYLALTEVFEYMVGNPDWSAFGKGPGEEECCHNTQPIGNQSRGPVFPVAYDFDITGLVNPRYGDRLFGADQRNLGIRRIRDRVYRGICPSNAHLPAVLARFNEKKDAIYAMWREEPGLEAETRKDALEYLDAFYAVINDPRKVESEMVRKCRS